MSRRTNNQIIKPHLILCEGVDEENFLIYWLNSPALSFQNAFANDIQVMDFGGNEDLPDFLNVIQTYRGFQKVSSLLVIRDAERDVNKAKHEVISAFERAELPVPEGPYVWESGRTIKTGFLLFPTCDKSPHSGTLEDLCLDILAEENSGAILGEVKDFIEILKKKHQRPFPHEFKSKLHTYFSVTDDFVSLKIGEAAKAGAFDWNHPRLYPMRDFLLELFPTA